MKFTPRLRTTGLGGIWRISFIWEIADLVGSKIDNCFIISYTDRVLRAVFCDKRVTGFIGRKSLSKI